MQGPITAPAVTLQHRYVPRAMSFSPGEIPAPYKTKSCSKRKTTQPRNGAATETCRRLPFPPKHSIGPPTHALTPGPTTGGARDRTAPDLLLGDHIAAPLCGDGSLRWLCFPPAPRGIIGTYQGGPQRAPGHETPVPLQLLSPGVRLPHPVNTPETPYGRLYQRDEGPISRRIPEWCSKPRSGEFATTG